MWNCVFIRDKEVVRVSEEIRRRIQAEEFDYQSLLDGLKEYARPRDKITGLLRSGDIIRVKKGLYIFGEKYRRRPYSREVLANLIYGPSYISLEYALHYHGLIPERAEAVTSVTSGRSRRFSTPVGLFTYWGIPQGAFRHGMDQFEVGTDQFFLMAGPEKALCDKIQQDRGATGGAPAELEEYIVDQLRVDIEALAALDADRIEAVGQGYRSRKLLGLALWVRQLRLERRG